MKASVYCIPFEECDNTMIDRVGGKCASLGELLKAQISVPPGFAVTTETYRRFLEDNGLTDKIQERLEGLNYSAVDEVNRASEDIRAWIESGALNEHLVDYIADNYRLLSRRTRTPACPVAVRSSATAEDLPDASFAGQQETYLWVRGADDVLEATLKCWSSLFTPRAISYRAKKGFDHSKVLISVAIQKMVRSFTAGVMFTLNPATGDPSTVVIDSNWGYGESVVSGEVTPDQFRVCKVTLDVTQKTVSTKDIYYTTDPKTDQVVKLEVDEERRNSQSLLDAECVELAKIAKQIEQHYGKPMDVEWATEKSLPYKGEIYILQSRPETVWSQKAAKPIVESKSSPVELIAAYLIKGRAVK